MNKILLAAQQVLDNESITYEQALELIQTPDEDLMLLLAMADKIRQKFVGDKVDLCAIVNARSGRCPEDCAFCAQSAHHNTGVTQYPLLSEEELLKAAEKAKKAGVNRFSIVTSGRAMSQPKDFDTILKALSEISSRFDMKICASLGILTLEQAKALADVGVDRYHANIETAASYFPQICTTHTFEDKLFTIGNAKAAGLTVCSGGILGLGESLEQRVEFAFNLKKLEITSVPVNMLHQVPGSRLENMTPLKPTEILKALAVFRFILPKANIRTAGGRERNLRDLQSMALCGGANGMLIGGYLTTQGRQPIEDITMLKDLGRDII